MAVEETEGAVISEEESKQLEEELTARTSKVDRVERKGQPAVWGPRDEGASGHPVAPTPATTSRDQSPLEAGDIYSDAGGDAEDEGTYHDSRDRSSTEDADLNLTEVENDSGPDMEALMEGLTAYIDTRLVSLKEEILTRVEFNGGNIAELSKTIGTLTSRLSVLAKKVELKQPLPVVTIKPPSPTPSTAPVVGPSHERRSSRQLGKMSAALVPSTRDTISEFLEKNPNYPRIQLVRTKLVRKLGSGLGFNWSGPDISPEKWTAAGLLEALTKEN